MSTWNEFTCECTCGEVDCWYCDDLDPFSSFNLPIRGRSEVIEGGTSMPNITYAQILQAQELQAIDQKECDRLYQLHEELSAEVKQKMKWIAATKRKLQEAERWVNAKDAEKMEVWTQHDRLEDTIRIRSDYIILEQQKYPLQFPNA